MSKQSKHDQQVERERVLNAAAQAEREAASARTAEEAKQTFWQRFKSYLGSV